jgi:N-acetylglutamate synthase-like GNAT family acetyltransferase
MMQALIDACGHEVLYMHSTLQLISFYKTFGFVPIPEDQLPKMIGDRFLFCFGEMAGCKRSAPCRGRREFKMYWSGVFFTILPIRTKV